MVTSTSKSEFRNPGRTKVIYDCDRRPKSVTKGGIHRETFEAAHVIRLSLYKVFTFAELRNRKPYSFYVETCAEGPIMKGACPFYDSLHNVLCLRSFWSKEAVTQMNLSILANKYQFCICGPYVHPDCIARHILLAYRSTYGKQRKPKR